MCGHFFDHGIGKVAAAALPVAAAFIPGVGPIVSAALTAGAGGLSARLQGGSWSDALKGAALSGAGSLAGSALTGAFPETTKFLGLGSNPLASARASLFGDSNAATLGSGTFSSAANGGSAFQQAANAGGGTFNVGQDAGGFNFNTPGLDSLSNAGNGAGDIAAKAGSKPWWTASDLGVDGVPIAQQLANFTGEHPYLTAGAGALAMAANSQASVADAQRKQTQDAINAQKAKSASDNSAWQAMLNQPPLARTVNPNSKNFDYAHYGEGPEQMFYDKVNPPYSTPIQIGQAPVASYKHGGAVRVPSALPIHKGPVKSRTKTGGQADKIPANLSEDEHVIPADVVAHLGDGSSDAGHEMLHKLVAAVRQQKTSSGTKLPPPAKSPAKYMEAK